MLKHFLIAVLVFGGASAPAAEFTVMHGRDVKALEKVEADLLYAEQNSIEVDVDGGRTPWLEHAQRVASTISVAVLSGTKAQKRQQAIAAVASMSSPKECSEFIGGDSTVDAPVCLVRWDDPTVTDCGTVDSCFEPGKKLCEIAGATHMSSKRNAEGDACVSTCRDPRVVLLVRCGG